MEIIQLNAETFRLINLSNDEILYTGSLEDCQTVMYAEEDKRLQEEFINKIKTDDEFAKKWGELGPIYGKQWRSWKTEDEYLDGVSYFKYSNIDQISNLINELKTNPDSRRLMISA